MYIAARAACARGLARSSTAASAVRARRPSSSAGARRGGTRPRRCGCRSGRGCAAPACSRSPAGPTAACGLRRADEARRARRPARATQPAPSRSVASTSGRLLENTSQPSSGGGWLATVWVCHGAVLARGRCPSASWPSIRSTPSCRHACAAGRSLARLLAERDSIARPATASAPQAAEDRTWPRSR